MSFWTNPNVHPKVKSKFVLVMGPYIWPCVKSVTKPSVDVEIKEFKMINHYYKYPGLVKWKPIKMTFVDGAGEWVQQSQWNSGEKRFNKTEDIPWVGTMNTAQLFYQMLINSGYQTPDKSGLSTPSKAAMADLGFFGSFKIQQINSIPSPRGGAGADNPKLIVVEEWELINPAISSISWGDLAYGDDGLVEYSMDIEYDYAKMTYGHRPITLSWLQEMVNQTAQDVLENIE